MKKGNWHIPPEENTRRMNLYKQGLSDAEIAARLGLKKSTIQRWRTSRGLPPNVEPTEPSVPMEKALPPEGCELVRAFLRSLVYLARIKPDQKIDVGKFWAEWHYRIGDMWRRKQAI